VVKFDSYLQLTLDSPLPFAQGDPLTEDGAIAKYFGTLHDLAKQLLRASLSVEAARRIKLDV
jgi:hypothetical protein